MTTPFLQIQKKEQIQIAITAALVLVLGFLLWNNSQKAKIKSGFMAAEDLQGISEFQNELTALTPFETWEQEARKITLKRDPFYPVIEESASGFYLNGIVWDQEQPTAIINNAIFAVGDTVNGFQVVAIEQRRVLLNDGKNDLELKLEEKK